MKIGGDIIVLATPAIGGLPYVVSGMVAAGGLAAALSTADGLLLTIANALSHDLYYKMIDPDASSARRVAISKALLLVVAMAAAAVAAQRPADILFLVSAAFSFAARGLLPGADAGHLLEARQRSGAPSAAWSPAWALTFYYMATTQPWLRGVFGVTRAGRQLWWGIQPIAAGVFGVPLGFAVIVVVSLLTPPPSAEVQALVRARALPEPGPRGAALSAAAARAACYTRGLSLAAPTADAPGRLPPAETPAGNHKEYSCVTTRSFC